MAPRQPLGSSRGWPTGPAQLTFSLGVPWASPPSAFPRNGQKDEKVEQYRSEGSSQSTGRPETEGPEELSTRRLEGKGVHPTPGRCGQPSPEGHLLALSMWRARSASWEWQLEEAPEEPEGERAGWGHTAVLQELRRLLGSQQLTRAAAWPLWLDGGAGHSHLSASAPAPGAAAPGSASAPLLAAGSLLLGGVQSVGEWGGREWECGRVTLPRRSQPRLLTCKDPGEAPSISQDNVWVGPSMP